MAYQKLADEKIRWAVRIWNKLVLKTSGRVELQIDHLSVLLTVQNQYFASYSEMIV